MPDFQTLMRPVLAHLGDGVVRSVPEIVAHVSDEFELTDEERAQLIPSGGQRMVHNKTH